MFRKRAQSTPPPELATPVAVRAFTLAEVLITLGIIGVVAALTIPTLIGNYKKQEVTSRLKKFYSTFSNALNMSVSENEAMNTWEFPEHQNNGDEMEVFVNKYIFPYFQGVKQCGAKDTVCRQDIKLFSQINTAYLKQPIYVFADGGCFSMLKGGGSSESGMIHIMYDINCNKGPNEYDRDIFAFVIGYNTNGSFKFIPGGQHTSMNANNRNKLLEFCKNNNTSADRGSCSALIYFDGWEIADDYPHRI